MALSEQNKALAEREPCLIYYDAVSAGGTVEFCELTLEALNRLLDAARAEQKEDAEPVAWRILDHLGTALALCALKPKILIVGETLQPLYASPVRGAGEEEGGLSGAERESSLLPPKGWRPIESAPAEDGAEAILWFPDFPEAELQVGRLRWYGDPSDEGSIGIWQDRYTGEDFENARDGMVFPTHFMPLPPAPVTKTE